MPASPNPFMASKVNLVSLFHSSRLQVSAFFRSVWPAIKPEPAVWKGASFGIILVSAILLILKGWSPGPSPWPFLSVLGLIVVGLAFATLSGLLTDPILWVLNRLPELFRKVLVGFSVVLALMVFTGSSVMGTLVLTAVILVPAAFLGAGLYSLLRPSETNQTAVRRILAWFSLTIGVAGLVGAYAWYQYPGPSHEASPEVVPEPLAAAAATPLAELEDPSQPGPFPVLTLNYGSGNDLHRPEFGAQVDLKTGSVDGSPFIGNWANLSGDLRTRFWGFDQKHLPLNGRVWYPEGQGPFPLVLMVHGNHAMMDFSDPGYGYLGELLASRGIIFVSVDENFLNGSWTDIQFFGIEGLKGENDARAWLLLEHLQQWQQWNKASGNPFYAQVDLERIALIGHSRGGEAASIAAAFNRLPYYPDNANIQFDYGFAVRAVAAIAPSDGQYRPSDRSTPLENIDYLTMQGSHDGDVRPFSGIRQYNRVTYSDNAGGFKAAVYINRANHGQFNTTWGRADSSSFPQRGLLNLAPILPETEQQQVAKVFLSAFLEAALQDRAEYAAVFQDTQTAQTWLPEIQVLSRYEDSHTRFVATFEEDLDLTTASLPQVSIQAQDLTLWYEKAAELKSSDQQSNAVYLGWDTGATGQPASYRLRWEADTLADLQPEDALVLAVADGNQNPNPYHLGNTTRSTPEPSGSQGPVDFTIELVDQDGEQARLPLSHFAAVQPQIEFYPFKARFLERPGTRPGEPVLQSFQFFIHEFQAENPHFNPAMLTEIRLQFDQTPSATIVVDNMGFRIAAP